MSKVLLCVSVILIGTTVYARRVIRAAPGSDTTGYYIVKLEDDTSHEKFEELAGDIAAEAMDGIVHEKVEGMVSKMVTAKLSEDALHRIKQKDNVEFLEEETYATGAQVGIPWHLDRIDQRSPVNNGHYRVVCGGEGIDIYILDTGIRYDHSEFEGRAVYAGYDPVDHATGSNQQGADCHSHGTHVASVAAGKTYGVAKKARVYSMRVLDCSNSAPWSFIIDGMNHAAEQASQSGRPSIISMSLSGRDSVSVDAAVHKVVNTYGIPVVVAAGNDNVDACSLSPSSTAAAITVGATAYGDNMYVYSNGGSCVDVFAPGEDILAASYSCSNCTVVYSGTSMATPIVSGIVATLLETNPQLTPAEIHQQLINASTKDAINFQHSPNIVRDSTPNRIVYIAECDHSKETVTHISTTTVSHTHTVTETIFNVQQMTLTTTLTATATRTEIEASVQVNVTQLETVTKVSISIMPTTVLLTPSPTCSLRVTITPTMCTTSTTMIASPTATPKVCEGNCSQYTPEVSSRAHHILGNHAICCIIISLVAIITSIVITK